MLAAMRRSTGTVMPAEWLGQHARLYCSQDEAEQDLADIPQRLDLQQDLLGRWSGVYSSVSMRRSGAVGTS